VGEPKTEASIRIIPLFDKVKEMLLKKNRDHEFIFEVLHKKQMRDYAKMITTRIGIKFNNHMFRHTFASNCIAKGINPKTVQKWLGHTKLDMTMNTYVDVVAKLEESDIDKYNNKDN
ncbi:MAG: tyrosine-type recombinase/integrase, partial [Bacteroidales bacterium]|nr:tyrosine-type recombinase/integrase [Bacteroidales bacterium]